MQRWLLLRGLSREQRHWGPFPATLGAALAADVRCIDPPGFGTEHERTSPARIAAIVDDLRARVGPELEAGDLNVLGISLGGMLAMDWCARHPGDFGRCVLINTSASNVSRPLQRFRPTALAAVAKGGRRDQRGRELATLEACLNLPGHDLERLASAYAAWHAERPPSSASLLRQVAAAARFAAPPTMPVPTLVLVSRGDRMVDHRCGERLARRFNASLRVHPDGGHDLALDDPRWVCEQISAW